MQPSELIEVVARMAPRWKVTPINGHCYGPHHGMQTQRLCTMKYHQIRAQIARDWREKSVPTSGFEKVSECRPQIVSNQVVANFVSDTESDHNLEESGVRAIPRGGRSVAHEEDF